MKRALVRADGFITDIINEGEEFEVYTGPGSGLRWIDMPDEGTIDWKLELGEWIPDFEFHDPETVRIVAYGDPGMQLSKLYKDIKNGLFGEAAKEGEFFKHIESVKNECAPVQYDEEGQKVLPDEPFPHSEEIPAWLTEFEIPVEAQQEFKVGAWNPNLHDGPATETMADQPITTAPAQDEAVDTNPELGEAPTEHPPE
tara:strand:- start:741 stop:1337 length:597 start_codon:yes stop_codon:yes gene_type:complete